jgi:hypothetical protein
VRADIFSRRARAPAGAGHLPAIVGASQCAEGERAQMKNVLITGGAGFIGRHLADHLVACSDVAVTVIGEWFEAQGGEGDRR